VSSGSSGTVDCGRFGEIEFTHTKRALESLSSRLGYDARRRLLAADASLAWEDLRAARRNLHLVYEEALHEHLV
jgi:hypothetical protein